MKWFKLFDIGIQLIITTAAIVLRKSNGFYIFYAGMGAWQVLSCLVHLLAYKRSERNWSRKGYERVLGCVFGIGLLNTLFLIPRAKPAGDLIYFEAFVMLALGVLMAAWYLITCIYELATENNTDTTGIETI